MSKKTVFPILIVAAMLVLVAALTSMLASSDQTVVRLPNNKAYVSDVARSLAERQQGLSGRSGLATNQAMLFAFETTSSSHCMWMKDMRFPIDIVWLSEDKTVVTIAANVTPETYPKPFCSKGGAKYVLEMPANGARDNALKVGDKLEFTDPT